MGRVPTDTEPGRNWGRLMAAAQEGDATAYKILLSGVAVWLRRYYAGRLPSAVTEDAVQDVLIAIHKKRHTYDPGHPFEPWLAAIARDKWMHRLRSLRSEAPQRFDESWRMPDHGDRVVAGPAFQQLLAEPRPRQAGAIRCATLEGDSVDAASHATGPSIWFRKVNIRRGFKRLPNIIDAAGAADRPTHRSAKPNVAQATESQRLSRNTFFRLLRFFQTDGAHPQSKRKSR